MPDISIRPYQGSDVGPFIPIPDEVQSAAAPQGGSLGPFQPITQADEAPSVQAAVGSPAPQAPTAPTTSASQRIAIDFNNQQQAAGQRTTPVVSAQQPFLVGPAMQNDAGEIGYQDASGNFSPTDSQKHVVLTDPNDNTPKVYLRNDITNEGAASSAGRMLSTMMGAGNIELSGPVEAAQSAAQAAQRLGIGDKIPRVIMSPSQTTQFVGQNVAEMPGGAPLAASISRGRSSLEGAVGNAAQATGGSPSAIGAGEGFEQSVARSIKPQEGQTRPESFLSRAVQGTSDAYDAVEKAVNPNIKVPLSNTLAKVSEIVARRGASGAEDFGKAANTVLEGATRPEGLTFAGIKDLRTRVGEMLDGGILPEGMSQGELKQIYGSLSDDLRAAAEKAGGREGLVAFERANSSNKMLAEWKDRLRGILGAQPSGENIYNSIIRMASSANGSADLRNLSIARASVPQKAWQDVASTAISSLGRGANGEWSPARFISDYAKLSDGGKRILFVSVGHGDSVRFLNDIAEVSNKFTQAGKLGNVSHSSGHVTGPLAILAAGEGIARGSWVEPVVAVTALVGNNIMARLLSTPATAASMARWSRAYLRVAQNPGPGGIAALGRSSREFIATVNGQFSTKFDPASLIRATQAPASADARQNQQPVPGRPGQ